jgi:hypothetical protein
MEKTKTGFHVVAETAILPTTLEVMNQNITHNKPQNT